MFKKIMLASVVASALSISAFAACGGTGQGMEGGCGPADKGAGCSSDKGMKNKKSQAKGCMDSKRGCCCSLSSIDTVTLSADQKAKIDAIREDFRMQMAKLHMKEKPVVKDPFVNPNGFDKESFKKERVEKMQKHLDIKADELAAIWAVLTPEQQKSIMELSK